MDTNHEMSYYNYGKTLSAEGVVKSWLLNNKGNDNHEYVDLGLKVKWATCNIGASSPEEAGLYFAWGETNGYTSEQVGVDKYFIWEDFTDESGVTHHNDYKFGPYNGEDETNYGMTKYNSEGPTELESEDDAAAQIWKNGWRMPTKEEFEELISSANTETIFTEQNGVSGLLVTSKVEGYEGNSVFFPAVGEAADGIVEGVGEYGDCLAVSLSDDDVIHAFALDFEG